MNKPIIKISTLLAYIFMVAINYLAVFLPLGGRSTGQISDNYFNLFTPAGYAFSIWGLIYTLLGIYVIYQLWQGKNEVLAHVNQIFIVNALLNASWIFAWHYNLIWLSVLFMFGLLFTLIRIVNILRESVLNQKERWIMYLPFSIYFGWITVATIANITVFLVYIEWDRFGLSDSFWTVVVLLVGTLIGSWRMLIDRFIPYGLVLIWAYTAILARHLSASGFDGQYPSIIWTLFLCIIVFLGIIVFISIKKLSTHR